MKRVIYASLPSKKPRVAIKVDKQSIDSRQVHIGFAIDESVRRQAECIFSLVRGGRQGKVWDDIMCVCWSVALLYGGLLTNSILCFLSLRGL